MFKVETNHNAVKVTHATAGDKEEEMTKDDFFSSFKKYFDDNGRLIDQAWNPNLVNGMVRCYLSGNKVAGFGYQEINALYPSKRPGQRYYFSEDCGLFQDLRNVMEKSWVPELQKITGVKTGMLPIIWDADFFINKVNTDNENEKYSLCEINVSCVSPFPESAIPYIAEEVKKRINS